MPTGRLLSAFRVANAVTSMTLSPSGDMLATTHVDSLGIMLWANRSLYAAVDLRPLPPGFDPLDLPLATALGGGIEAQIEPAPEEFESPRQIEDCITLSGLAQAKWAVLPHLAVVRTAPFIAACHYI
jgi:U3 small nucleolar RNA-associated protein 21